jgi:hypothetical protein
MGRHNAAGNVKFPAHLGPPYPVHYPAGEPPEQLWRPANWAKDGLGKGESSFDGG